MKLYDKAFTVVGNVLRAETTIQQERDFTVYRAKEGDPGGEKDWRPLRRGIADLHRRAEVSQRANERYLQALAGVDDSATVEELTQKLTQPVQVGKYRVRGLRLLDAADTALLETVARGEFTINGFRNRDLQPYLYSDRPASAEDGRKRSNRVGRQLRLLVSHGLSGAEETRLKPIVPVFRKGRLATNGAAFIDPFPTAEGCENTAKEQT